jgi:hypothetical protein
MDSLEETHINSEDALRIAKLREHHTLARIFSRNRLAIHAPFMMKYVRLLYQ